MKLLSRRGLVWFALLACAALLAGCAATTTAIRYSDLKVETKMSASIFMDPVAPAQRTAFVQIRNTSGKPFDIAEEIKARLRGQGYNVVEDPNRAHYMVQANVLQVGETDQSALESASAAGFGGVVAGAATGAVIGAATNSSAVMGGAIGGLAAGAIEAVSGSAVKVVWFSVITDLQISERAGQAVSEQFNSNLKQGTGDTTIKQQTGSTTSWKKYQTRIVSSARKVSLTWEEAYPPLREGIVGAIGGVL